MPAFRFCRPFTALLAGLVALLAVPGRAQNPPKIGAKTTIRLTIQTCARDGKAFAYAPAKSAYVAVMQGKATLFNDKEKRYAWTADENGKLTIELDNGNGHPFTLHVYGFGGGSGHAPQIQTLSAKGNEHTLEVAVLELSLYQERVTQNPYLPPANELVRQTLRDAGAKLKASPAKEDGAFSDSLVKLEKDTRPASSQHPYYDPKTAPKKNSPLPRPHEQAVRHCLAEIRKCAITAAQDKEQAGAFRGMSDGAQATVKARFGASACLALLAGVEYKLGSAPDLDLVNGWVDWFLRSRGQDGIPEPLFGFFGQLKPPDGATGDSTVEGLAGFLRVVARLHAADGKRVGERAFTAATEAASLLRQQFSEAAMLTRSDPEFADQCLLRVNCEAYAACVEAGMLFRKVAQGKLYPPGLTVARQEPFLNQSERAASRLFDLADRIALGLAELWQEPTLPVGRATDGGEAAALPDGLNTAHRLAALAAAAELGEAKKATEVWDSLTAGQLAALDDKETANGWEPPAKRERWLLAAANLARLKAIEPKELTKWKDEVVKEAMQFGKTTVVYRPAEVVLALLDGPVRQPAVVKSALPARPKPH